MTNLNDNLNCNLILNNMNYIIARLIIMLVLSASMLIAHNNSFEVKSPDGVITVKIEVGAKLLWSVTHDGQQIILPSSIALQLEDGQVLGYNAVVIDSKKETENKIISAVNYIKAKVLNQYNQLTINFKDDFGVIFRVYNDAAAYRFVTSKVGDIIIKNEEANFNFTGDYKTFMPFMWDYRENKIFNSSFEALYHEITFSQFPPDSLAFLPLLVDVGNNKKVVITEVDLEDYPGMYMNINETQKGLKGVYAPYPLEAHLGGFGNINYVPTKRADYIAKTNGTRNFPWRAVVVSKSDKELLANDIVQKLASPPRIKDISWITTGQSTWDWWNARNISHVDFKVGLNLPTYKYYVDFAAANNIKFVLVEGALKMDLTQMNPDLNLPELIKYAKKKGVEVVTWASWYQVTQQMDTVFPFYAKMGLKGFKIDFVDRDDQVAVESIYKIARKAAEYHLLVDFHGMYKPTGIQRTYPNVIGFEGVKGLENYKWAVEDQPRYVVTIPYIRMLAGPMDYTPGAMRNANKANFRPINDNPMSQGTRCAQLAMYIIFEAPFQMLADNLTVYMKEKECFDFITKVPTTFDETVPLDGKVGEYSALARKKGDIWYVGAMTDWTSRDLTLDFLFLGKGTYKAVVFKDGVNSDRDGTDYKKEVIKISAGDKLNIHLAPGGGRARIEKVK